MKSWKWSIGEPYYKSSRKKPSTDVTNEEIYDRDPGISYDTRDNAINQSLNDDPFLIQDTELLNITNSIFSRHQNPSGTSREDIDNKMANRELVVQRGINPFLQTSYVNDIVAHDIFLKPISTSLEKVKNNSTEGNENNR
jgi:hypothetical protein